MEDVLPQNEETTEEEVDMLRGQRSSANRVVTGSTMKLSLHSTGESRV